MNPDQSDPNARPWHVALMVIWTAVVALALILWGASLILEATAKARHDAAWAMEIRGEAK